MTSRLDTSQRLSDLALLRRVRDRIDREYALPLDVEALARGAHMSAGHLSRQFRLAYGESPYSYLMTRRIERAMALLRRGDLSAPATSASRSRATDALHRRLWVGQDSLVFGAIAAESQRLINETYSAFVQGFMPTLARPEVDVLDGLTTAIIVDQERMGPDPALFKHARIGSATGIAGAHTAPDQTQRGRFRNWRCRNRAQPLRPT